jgi:hypothetical protein
MERLFKFPNFKISQMKSLYTNFSQSIMISSASAIRRGKKA